MSISFKRGQTFSISVAVPSIIADGALAGWIPSAQIRKANNGSPSGLITALSSYWDNPATTRNIHLYHNLTEDWPLGKAEVDVLFTSPGGEKLYSETLEFTIERGITR